MSKIKKKNNVQTKNTHLRGAKDTKGTFKHTCQKQTDNAMSKQ